MKKRILKDYQNLPEDLRAAIWEKYTHDFSTNIITFFDQKKQLISALPYETEEISYLIKLPASFNIDDDEDDSASGLEIIPEGVNLENLDEEKFLMQEEEEEESD